MNRQADGLLAKPKQAKVLTGGRVLGEAQIDVRLLAIPAIDRLAGFTNRELNCNRG